MAGGTSQRFAREEQGPAPATAEHGELLQHLERQTEALSETKVRLSMVEKALSAERATRQQLGVKLAAERAESQRLRDQIEESVYTADTVAALEQELHRERAGAKSLVHRLDEAWAELQSLQARLDDGSGLFRRRRPK